MQPLQDRGRRAGGRKQSIGVVRDQLRKTSLRGGGNVWHRRVAPCACDRQRAQRTGPDVGLQRQYSLERERDFASEQRRRGRVTAAIRHVLQRQTCQLIEQLAGQV